MDENDAALVFLLATLLLFQSQSCFSKFSTFRSDSSSHPLHRVATESSLPFLLLKILSTAFFSCVASEEAAISSAPNNVFAALPYLNTPEYHFSSVALTDDLRVYWQLNGCLSWPLHYTCVLDPERSLVNHEFECSMYLPSYLCLE